jgi:hypothetical protein
MPRTSVKKLPSGSSSRKQKAKQSFELGKPRYFYRKKTFLFKFLNICSWPTLSFIKSVSG